MMQLDKALKIGNFLIGNLAPGCMPGRCVIAGSGRRRKTEVKDLEIVAMPLPGAPRPEFGQRNPDQSYLDRQLRLLVEDGWLKPVIGGDKFKKFEFGRVADFGAPEMMNPFMLDLFLVTPPSQWGVVLVIRTGPADFSQWMVTQRSKRGALPDGYFMKHNVVWREGTEVPNRPEKAIGLLRGGHAVEMAEEEDWFKFCGLDWLEPRMRMARWGLPVSAKMVQA